VAWEGKMYALHAYLFDYYFVKETTKWAIKVPTLFTLKTCSCVEPLKTKEKDSVMKNFKSLKNNKTPNLYVSLLDNYDRY
jgi:hypothetical protein